MRGRIRSVKPEIFKDEELWDLAMETGLPVFQAFEGLWCYADKEGRFEWRPRSLKTDILPYWEGDFSRVLDALTTRGFVVRYESNGREYGWVRTFKRHQVINNRESESELPPPPAEVLSKTKGSTTREPRVDHASTTREQHAQAEGNGKGREWERERASAQPPPRHVLLTTVAADLVAANQFEPPPVGHNPAIAELEPGEPEPPIKLAPPRPLVSPSLLAEFKTVIAAEALRMGFERTPRAAEGAYLQAAEDCVHVAQRRGAGTLGVVLQEFSCAALKLLQERPAKGLGFALQDACLGAPEPQGQPARASPRETVESLRAEANALIAKGDIEGANAKIKRVDELKSLDERRRSYGR